MIETRRLTDSERCYRREDYDFVVEDNGVGLRLYFVDANDGSDSHRLEGRAFRLIEATLNGTSLVTEGTCNYTDAIDAMRDFKRRDSKKQVILDRIEAAREELRTAERELEALGS